MENYDDGYYLQRESWLDFRLEMDALIELASLSRQDRVLEVGCGSGKLVRRLSQGARLTVGVDLSEVGLAVGNANVEPGSEASTGLIRARAECLPFSDGSFDAILSQHLIEHLPDPLGALHEWRRVLRAGGVLALVTPNADYPDASHFADPSHGSLFTPDTIRSVVSKAGFRVERVGTLFPYFGRSRVGRALSIRFSQVGKLAWRAGPWGRSIILRAKPTQAAAGGGRQAPALRTDRPGQTGCRPTRAAQRTDTGRKRTDRKVQPCWPE